MNPSRTVLMLMLLVFPATGCKVAGWYRKSADRVAYDLIQQKQKEALGQAEPFTVEQPDESLHAKLIREQNLPTAGPETRGTKFLTPLKQWPLDDYFERSKAEEAPTSGSWSGEKPEMITLVNALQIAAKNNRDYQTQKETVFLSALRLDLQLYNFKTTFSGAIDALLSHDRTDPLTPVTGYTLGGILGFARKFKNGVQLTSRLGYDLAHLLSPTDISSRALSFDASITVPLLRGSGKEIVAEPLTQAERNLVYALYNFDRYRRTFAVRVATSYLSILQRRDQVKNSEENYRGLIASARRMRRLADAGIRPDFEVDQAVQNELRARDGWVRAVQNYLSQVDSFKILLGLPTDTKIELDHNELQKIVALADKEIPPVNAGTKAENVPPADAPIELNPPSHEGAGPWELDARKATELALKNRLDLKVALGQVFDNQRQVVVAADALRADLTIGANAAAGGSSSLGSAASPDPDFDFKHGVYTAPLTLNLPLDRRRERDAYRQSLIALEQAMRDAQELEDQIKLDIADELRNLLEFRESLQIQRQALALAERRVKSTNLYLQAGRAQIRDLLDAQDALLSAENALTAALISYRVGELELQRDLEVLQIDEHGLWHENIPQETSSHEPSTQTNS